MNLKNSSYEERRENYTIAARALNALSERTMMKHQDDEMGIAVLVSLNAIVAGLDILIDTVERSSLWHVSKN